MRSEGDRSEGAPDRGAVELLGFRLRHVGVAVPEFETGAKTLGTIFGYEVVAGPFDDPIQKVRVAFLKQSGADAAEVELIAPLSPDAPIQALLARNVGAYHLCFETADLEGALEHARAQGCIVISGPVPAVAFGGRRIAWIYSASRQLFELLEITADTP